MHMNNAIRLGKILNIPIRIHYSWFIVFALVVFTLVTAQLPQDFSASPLIYWIIGVITALLIFASVLAHELSHSYVAKLYGIQLRGITLFIFGGVAEITSEPETSSAELKIAAAGPLCSITIGLFAHLFQFLVLRLNGGDALFALFKYVKFVNFAVVVFNLVPGFPLDGGRILRAILWKFSGNLKRATRIASSFGQGFAYIIMLWGLFSLFQGYFLDGVWLIFIGWFLENASKSSYQHLLFRRALSGIKVREVMSSYIVSIPPDLNLEELVENFFFRYRHTNFPVVAEDLSSMPSSPPAGRILGNVSVHDVKKVDKNKWPFTQVSEIMTPLEDKLLISPEEEAVNALKRMLQDGVKKLLVIEDNIIIGIIAFQDLMDLFRIKTDLGEE